MSASQTPDDSLDTLAHLLDTRAVPFGGMNLEALDGFFSALAVGPEQVPSDEWMAEVWGPKPPNWESPTEAREVLGLLTAHRDLVAERVRHAGDEITERLLPVLWLPESDDDPEAAYVGHDWALGFLRGIDLRRPAWEAWFEREEWIAEIYLEMISLVLGRDVTRDAPGEEDDIADDIDADNDTDIDAGIDTDTAANDADHADAAGDEARAEDGETSREAPPLTPAERIEIVLDLPWLLYDLNVHRVEALTPRTPIRAEAVPGRNDPCHCGSGKKYKKCCGAG